MFFICVVHIYDSHVFTGKRFYYMYDNSIFWCKNKHTLPEGKPTNYAYVSETDSLTCYQSLPVSPDVVFGIGGSLDEDQLDE